jgi:hypothetical protein
VREEEPPEDLESRMRRQRVKHVKEMEKAVKPKTLDARGGIKPAN